MTDAKCIFGLFFTSEACRARFSPFRLRACLGEVALQGWDFAVFSSENCNIESGEMTVDLWRHGRWDRTVIEHFDVVLYPGSGPVLSRQRDVFRWLSNRFPVVRADGPDKSKLPFYLDGFSVAGKLIPQQILESGRVEDALIDAMRSHGSIVVKPAASSSGRGIRFILKEGDTWHLRYGGKSQRGNIQAVARAVAQDIGERAAYRTMVMQKFIHSRSPDDRALQFRVDLAKGDAGDWQVLGSFSHLAEIGEFASNLAFGGYLGSLQCAAKRRSIRPSADIVAEALDIAVNTAKALDSHVDVTIFELGVDLLIDENDRIWLLEANLQPDPTLHEPRRAELAVGFAMAAAGRRGANAQRGTREHG